MRRGHGVQTDGVLCTSATILHVSATEINKRMYSIAIGAAMHRTGNPKSGLLTMLLCRVAARPTRQRSSQKTTRMI